jgi:hypothetical protein
MTVARRDVLKGLIFSSASGAFSSPVTHWISAAGMHNRPVSPVASPIHILAADSSQYEAFLEGATRSARRLGAEPSVIHLNGSLFDDLSPIHGLLSSGQTLIALLHPADGVVLLDLARSSGLRLAFLGHHNLGDRAWPQRHQLTTLPQSAGLGSTLSAGLGKRSFIVTETPLGSESGLFQTVPGFEAFRVNARETLTMHLAEVPVAEGCSALGISAASVNHLAACSGVVAPSARPWAELLGDSLMQVACGSWRPATSGPQAFVSRGDGGKLRHESLTSMVIQG